ncbi:MAG: hypothetical protein AAYR33_01420 [Acetobacteraceae bacterium]
MRERRSSAPTTTIYQRRLDSVMRAVLPSLFIIVVTFLLTGVISPVGKEGFVFAVAVDTVFYWTIFRPASMDATAVFLIGLVLETINFSPPGTLLFSLLVVHGVAQMWRYGLSHINFILAWLLLALLALAMGGVEWLVSCISMARGLPITPAIFQATLTSGIYPILATLFGWLRRIGADAEDI